MTRALRAEQLKQTGRAVKVRRVAVVRKLVTIDNAVLRDAQR